MFFLFYFSEIETFTMEEIMEDGMRFDLEFFFLKKKKKDTLTLRRLIEREGIDL